jgi:hypothetical protein
MATANLAQMVKNLLLVKTDDPADKAMVGLALLFGPLLVGGSLCPYSRYVQTHGVETRVFVGTRHDN